MTLTGPPGAPIIVEPLEDAPPAPVPPREVPEPVETPAPDREGVPA